MNIFGFWTMNMTKQELLKKDPECSEIRGPLFSGYGRHEI